MKKIFQIVLLLSAVIMISTVSLFIKGETAYGYNTVGDGWDGPGLGHADLTWYLASETADMTNLEQTNLIDLALSDWALYADISFTYGSSAGAEDQLDFYLGATSSDTGGPWGGTYLPFAGGDVYIDDETSAPIWTTGIGGSHNDNWTGSTWTHADLYYLLHHEIGHALGMHHPVGEGNNLAAGAVMSPYYGIDSEGDYGHREYYTLQPDDIAGIQSLYGAPGPGPGPGPDPELVPEPTTIALLGIGLVGLAGAEVRRRRKKNAVSS